MPGGRAPGPLVRLELCGRAVFSLGVPERCPLCGRARGAGAGAPLGIPCPFADGHGQPAAFLLRPAQGAFLGEYDGRSDLHVGITNTKGVVYHYNEHGVQRDEAGWEQSLSIPLVQPSMFGLMERWDKCLEGFSAEEAWLPHRYEEVHHNCYSYALEFINRILSTEGREKMDKVEFTERFVIPRTRLASKYITLYRAIEQHGFYVAALPGDKLSGEGCTGLCEGGGRPGSPPPPPRTDLDAPAVAPNSGCADE